MSDFDLVDILAENDAEDSLETLAEDCGPGARSAGSVPPGWSLAGNGKVAAPDGKIYKNRRIALREMIVSGLFSRAEVGLMRSCLKFEGWRHSQDVPAGWMTKQRNRNVLLVTSDGDLFESVVSAARFVQKYQKYYSQGDLDKIKKLQTMGKPKPIKREKDVEMKTKQLSKVDKVELVKEKIVGLPSGWEVRDCKGGGKIFISSGGEKLNGISSALRFMVKHNLAEEEISQLREYSISLGWRPDPMLPPNWFVKRGSSKTTSYLGPMGEFFRTKDKMMRYLNIDVEDQKDSKLEVEHKVENSPAKKVKKSAKKSSSESWSPSDGTIPEGWKFKKSEDGNILYLLTPEGKAIPGRRCALKFLVENNSAEEKILEMRNMLIDYDDWSTDAALPQNWLYKVNKGKKKEILFCSPTGERFRQKEKAVQFLQNSGGSEEDVSMLRDFTRGLTDVGGWIDGDGTIPAGWKMKEGRIGDRTFTMLLTPCGRQIQGRRAALSFLVTNLYPESIISHMRRTLVQLDGWQEDPRLPENWLAKIQNRRKFLLCSPVGKQFESREKAIKYLQEMSGSEEDVKKLQQVPMTAGKSNTAKSTMKEDETETPEEEVQSSEAEGDDGDGDETETPEEEVQSSEAEGDVGDGDEEEIGVDDDSSLDQSTEDEGDISLETSAKDKMGGAPRRTSSFKSKKLYQDYSVFLSEGKLSSLVTVKAELSLLGWMEAPDLVPANWLIRLKPGFTNINFLTPCGKTLKSLPGARKYVQEKGFQFEFEFEKLKTRLRSL